MCYGTGGGGGGGQPATKRTVVFNYSDPNADGGVSIDGYLLYWANNDLSSIVGFTSTHNDQLIAAYNAGKKIIFEFAYSIYTSNKLECDEYFTFDSSGANILAIFDTNIRDEPSQTATRNGWASFVLQKGTESAKVLSMQSDYSDGMVSTFECNSSTNVTGVLSGGQFDSFRPFVYLDAISSSPNPNTDNDYFYVLNMTYTIEEDVNTTPSGGGGSTAEVLFNYDDTGWNNLWTVTDNTPMDLSVLLSIDPSVLTAATAALDAGKRVKVSFYAWLAAYANDSGWLNDYIVSTVYLGNYSYFYVSTYLTEPNPLQFSFNGSIVIRKNGSSYEYSNSFANCSPYFSNGSQSYETQAYFECDNHTSNPLSALNFIFNTNAYDNNGVYFWMNTFTIEVL